VPVNVRIAAPMAVVVVGLAFLTSWLLRLPLERAFVLAPVIVVCFGLLAMVGVLLTRAAIESVRELEHPRRFWIGLAVACVVIAVLGALGVELPREG
jgi:membrane protease YdiL (CAAX protease family)